MKLSSLFFILVLPLLAISCSFPERSRSIIPPTNERDLCRYDENYYYSTTFDFCFRYPSQDWQKTKTSLPKDVPGSNLTSIDFFLPNSLNENLLAFTLYITSPSEQSLAVFNDNNIMPVYDAPPYLIGYQTRDDETDKLIHARISEVPEMLERLQVFATTPY